MDQNELFLGGYSRLYSLTDEGVNLLSGNAGGIILSADIPDSPINLHTKDTGKVNYNGNEVATIATFTTDSEAEAYSTANPTVLVISTQQ
ncbi:MAG: hypothetical protein LUE93_01690 [Bacteroides sp.]|nr:hypothetical protein [Bacteroides sp.]